MKKSFDNLKVALIHDWLTGMRGGEKVLEVFCDMFPDSAIFTLLHEPGRVSPEIEKHQIYTSFIDKLPFKSRKYRNYLPLFPTAIELFNLKGYELILSSSHCIAKGVITPPDALHVSYIHTPMRYVWDMYHEYFGEDRLGIVGKRLIPLFANYLRMWDASSSSRVDRFIANSGHVARRINKFYGRESTVIHPPVETSVFSVSKTHNNYYLIVSALVPYKKVDLAIDAFNRMQKKLLIIGEGPEKGRLQKISGKTIEFIDWQPHDKLAAYYENCLALIFPGEEDFGIVPVEAMACGKPVVAYGRGGALETVIGKDDDPDKKSGIFFNDLNPESLIEAVEKCDRTEWDPDFIGEHARKFDIENFRSTVTEFISQELDDYYRKM